MPAGEALSQPTIWSVNVRLLRSLASSGPAESPGDALLRQRRDGKTSEIRRLLERMRDNLKQCLEFTEIPSLDRGGDGALDEVVSRDKGWILPAHCFSASFG
jgi:hypothetical protein